MANTKLFFLVLICAICIQQISSEKGEKRRANENASIEESSDAVTTEASVVDDLNGPSNETCSALTNCNSCEAQKCKWVSCAKSKAPQCVSILMNDCDRSACSNATVQCKDLKDCDSCLSAISDPSSSCVWQTCGDSSIFSCDVLPVEMCHTVTECNSNVSTTTMAPSNVTTVAPNGNITTTVAPDDNSTTTAAPETTTTAIPDTTTVPDTTTEVPTTVAPTTSVAPNGTTTESPDSTTVPPTTEIPNTTAAPAPTPAPSTGGGFSAGSFFGGIILTLSIIGLSFGGYKFYKTRYDVNYRTL